MLVKKLEIKNFLVFRKVTIDFELHSGTTLIEGKSHGCGTDSNGSGKSTIIEAVVWGLYGKTLRKLSADDVKSEGSESEGTRVKLYLRDGDRNYVIDRARNKSGPSLSISEEGKSSSDDPSHTLGVQERIENLIGMDYKTFTSSVVFGGEETASFCKKTDAERKSMLEKLLGLDYFAEAENLAKQDRDKLTSEITDIRAQTLNYQEAIESLETEISEDMEAMDGYADKMSLKLRKLRGEFSRSYQNYWYAYEDYLDWVDWWEAELKKKKDEREAYLKKRKELALARDGAKDDLAMDRAALEQARSTLKTEEKALRNLKESKHPDFCPTCGQVWKQDSARIDRLLEDQEKKIMEKKEIVTRARKALLSSEEEFKAKDAAYQKHEGQATLELDEPREMQDARYDAKQEFARLDSLRNQINEVKEESKDNPYVSRVKRTLTKIESLEEQFENVSEDLDKLEENLKYHTFWAESFNKKGLPSYLLDESVPALNKSAEEIANILTDGELKVVFDAAKAKGRSSKFDISICSAHSGSNYSKLSTGEKSRVDLCVLLSIRELVEARSTRVFEQMWIDELFDGMDSTGAERVVTLLRKRYADRSIFLISHDAEIKSLMGSQSILVKKNEQRESTVLQKGNAPNTMGSTRVKKRRKILL